MQAAPASGVPYSWFRTRGGRRFGIEFALERHLAPQEPSHDR